MFWPFYGLHLFEFARGYKYPWRVYPMPYPAMVRIRAPYTIYAIYVSGCPWSIREYIHSPSRSVCHFRANVFFHFSSTFSTLQINEHISGTLRSQVSGSLVSGPSVDRPLRPSIGPFEAIAWRQFSAKCYSKYLADGRFSCFICGKFRILLMCSLSCALRK